MDYFNVLVYCYTIFPQVEILFTSALTKMASNVVPCQLTNAKKVNYARLSRLVVDRSLFSNWYVSVVSFVIGSLTGPTSISLMIPNIAFATSIPAPVNKNSEYFQKTVPFVSFQILSLNSVAQWEFIYESVRH